VTSRRGAPPWSRLGALAGRVLEQVADPFQLDRYREANAALAAEDDGRPRVVFIGDSLIEYWRGLESLAPAGERWINRGLSGQTAAQILMRFESDAIAVNPASVVIVAGANDARAFLGPPGDLRTAALARVVRGVTAMTDIAEARGVRTVVAGLPPVAAPFPGRRHGAARRDPGVILAINAWLSEFTATRGHTFVDIHSALADPSGGLTRALTDDGVHPNPEGYRVLAALLVPALARAAPRH
jgi:lysophospholipase L1-like esterase